MQKTEVLPKTAPATTVTIPAKPQELYKLKLNHWLLILQIIQASLNDMEIRAPFTGIIGLDALPGVNARGFSATSESCEANPV